MKVAGDLYMNAELPLGDGSQTPDDFAKQQSASTGLPEALCRANMKKNQFVLERDGQHSEVAHARARPQRADDRIRRRERCADQLSGAEPRARARAALKLAGRAHPVAADHPDADRTRPEARAAGAVDAVSRRGGVLPGRHSARSDLDLSRRSRSWRGGRVGVRAQPDLRRHGDRRTLQGQPARAGARSRVLQDRVRRRLCRRLGALPGHDGRQRVPEQRPRLHQLLGHLGEPSQPRDCRCAGEAAGGREGAAA